MIVPRQFTICAEWNDDSKEHRRNERIGNVSAVFVNSIFFSWNMLAIQHPIIVKRHRSLMISALKGKKERTKK